MSGHDLICFRVLYVQDVYIICDSGPLPLTTSPAASPERSRPPSPRSSGMGVGQAGFLSLTPSQRASVRLKLPVTTTGYNYKTIDHVYYTLYFSMMYFLSKFHVIDLVWCTLCPSKLDNFNVPGALVGYTCRGNR